MRKPLAFRPVVLDRLEDRTVPSHTGTAAALVHHAALTPQQVVTAKVVRAYSDFVQSFTQDVNSDLMMPSVTGTGSNTAIFSEDLGAALTTLNKNVRKTMPDVSAHSPGAVQVHESILGSDANSLRMQLSNLSMTAFRGGYSIQGFQSEGMNVIHDSLQHVNKQVLAALASSTPTSTSSSTAVKPSTGSSSGY